MSIRIAIPQDSLQIATIHLESWRSAYQGIIPSAYIDRITLDARLSHWAKEIASGDLNVYVKVDPFDKVLGWIATGCDREYPEERSIVEVQAIYVSPLHTRRGIGREFVRPRNSPLSSCRAQQGRTLGAGEKCPRSRFLPPTRFLRRTFKNQDDRSGRCRAGRDQTGKSHTGFAFSGSLLVIAWVQSAAHIDPDLC